MAEFHSIRAAGIGNREGQQITAEPPEVLTLVFDRAAPEWTQGDLAPLADHGGRNRVQVFYTAEAEKVVDALVQTVPGGLLSAILGVLCMRAAHSLRVTSGFPQVGHRIITSGIGMFSLDFDVSVDQAEWWRMALEVCFVDEAQADTVGGDSDCWRTLQKVLITLAESGYGAGKAGQKIREVLGDPHNLNKGIYGEFAAAVVAAEATN